MSDAPLNGDMQQRIAVDAETLEWQQAPSGQVWRKRLHRVGPAEAGQVTSLVRYVPGAKFHYHPHPDGEEIFVLEGSFCDQQRVSGPGTYLLHPEGFEHAPWSDDGCLLFVKLRQYSGAGREYHTRDAGSLDWQPGSETGSDYKTLYQDDRFADATYLERWQPGVTLSARQYAGGVELYVLEGSFADEQGEYGAGTWLRLPPGGSHTPRSDSGCQLYVKTGGVAALDSA